MAKKLIKKPATKKAAPKAAAKPKAKKAAVKKPAKAPAKAVKKPVAKKIVKKAAKPAPAKKVVKPVAKKVAKPVAKKVTKPAAKPAAKVVAKVAPIQKPAAKVAPVAKPVVVAKPVPVAKPAPVVAPKPVIKPAPPKPIAKPVPPPPAPRPVPTERMSAADLAYFENLLVEKRASLVSELEAIEDANLSRSQTDQGGELGGYTNHLADAASDYTTLETNLELAEREGKYLIYIEEALERVRKGTYGICKVCSCLIPKARLEVVPTATKCVNCKQETKKREAVEQQQELARMYAKEALRKG